MTSARGEAGCRALVVLGMHRSGTSAVARLLMLLGADAPRRLMPPDAGNEKGHWEPLEMITLHDEIFRSMSTRWDDVSHLPPSWFESAAAREFEGRAAEMLREDYGDSRLFVVKDPRMCRTLPLWRAAFARYGADPSYVIVVRHPMEVASSLNAREEMLPARGLLLFLRDMLAVELETRGSPRVFVSYEQTLSNWRVVADRISESLDVTWPSVTHRTTVEVERFLSPSHRHHVATGEDLSGRREVVDMVKATYSILQEAAESGSGPDREALDEIRARLDEADRAFGPLLAEAELDAQTRGAELSRTAAQREQLVRQLTAQKQTIAILRQWVRYLEGSRSWRITRPLRALAAAVRKVLRRPTHRPVMPAISREAPSTAKPAPRKLLGRGESSKPVKRRKQKAPPAARSGATPVDLPSEESLVAWVRHLEGSRSWRITRPLRDLGAAVRRVRGKTVSQPQPPAISEAAPAPGPRPMLPATSGQPGPGRRDTLAQSMRRRQRLVLWIQHLEGSRSWRITRPLRSLGAFVRRLRGRQVSQPEPPAVSSAAPPGARAVGPARPPALGPGLAGSTPGGQRPKLGWAGPPRPPGPVKPAEPLVRGDADEVVAQIRNSTGPADAFEEFDPEIAGDRERLAKLIAFYLPQFHPIDENDEWWGKGFTDWRNVVRGTPRFFGHYQPRIPRDLGFYDLRDPEVMRRQTDLARAAGLHGFAFHYFSFGGRRLLERPIEQFLADPSIDFPFCVCWANENWTRRWDGLDEETLIRQEHEPGDDQALVDDLQRHFEDPRYIRVNGRPLFLVYRLDVLLNAREGVARWRELWRERHDEDPLILLVQSFEDDPRPYGADGAVEFPPQRLARWDNTISGKMHFFDPQFGGYVIDYESVMNTALQRQLPPYPWARGVTPSWDNDARRPGAGTILHGSSPELYERWLAGIVDAAQDHPVMGEPLVFVNAWNEWAEGAYLEPDLHYGGAYLNATARAVCRERSAEAPRPVTAAPRPPEKMKVLLVGHDAHPHGAQMNLRGLGDRLVRQFGCEVTYLLLEGGPLTADYREFGEVHICEYPEMIGPIARRLRKRGYADAIVQTLAAADALPPLKETGFRVLSLVQELPGMIRERGLERSAELVARHSNKVVFPATVVAESFTEFAEVPRERIAIRPQGLFREMRKPPASALEELRRELEIPDEARVVLNVGYADQRKGIDLFLETADLARSGVPDLHFVWLGNLNAEALELRAQAERSDSENIHFAGFTEEVSPYLELADVFFLSSREDPFPSVVLEAMHAGLSVVAFRDSGGSEPLAEEHGALVAAEDVPAALAALRRCATEENPGAAEARRRLVRDRYQYDAWAFDVLRLLDERLKKVSVVVPNHNYADYLAERLDSIFVQTDPIFELIVLDDASTDGSLGKLAEIREESGRRFRVIANEQNSGSVFKQWRMASELARGEYLWIAEADDACKPSFLARVMGELNDGLAFAFSDSAQINETGAPLGDSYQDYYRQSANGLMKADFLLDGDQFVRRCLLERNLVLNVSAVVWNRLVLKETLDRCLDELLDFKLAGDWYLYAATALGGKRVTYVSDPLSVHRRHENGVTGSLDSELHLEEVRRVHKALRDWLQADEDDRARMESYETELEQQFGLTS